MTATATVAPPGSASSVTTSRTPPASRTSLAVARRTSTPTLTPTAQQQSLSSISARVLAPQSVPGQPVVDANTLALYHFDDTSTANVDATGRYTATLHGSASIVPNSLYGGTLSLGGSGSYVSTGYVGSLDQGTVDLYVDFVALCNGLTGRRPLITIANSSGQDVLWLGDSDGGWVDGKQDWLMLYIFENGNTHLASSGINACKYLVGDNAFAWPYETWRFHHVAATWGPRGLEIWVDGVLHGVGYDDYASDPYFKYFCNPQMQLGANPWPPNELYPVCKTPVMAPTMPSYPHGDYAGTLPAYSTVRIGCDSGGVCSPGRFDEVRISDVQRTFTWTVDPTVTPTPTWTPVNPTLGEYGVDASTAALFHLNSSVSFGTVSASWDEVRQEYRAIQGNGTIIPGGRFNAGAYLGGYNSWIDMYNYGAPSTGTVEAWVDFASNPPAAEPLFTVVGDTRSFPLMWLGTLAQGDITFSMGGSATGLDSGVTPAQLVGCWHHLAATWGPRGRELWLDGQLRVADRTATGGIPTGVSYWRFGCTPQGACMVGAVDELRISSVQRTFSPSALRPIRATLKLPVRVLGPRLPDAGSGNELYLPFVVLGPTPAPPEAFPCP
ncbi:MAG: LamG domain-containing protein [Chloroflexi bacterium]|nr:LamG domain-containing protein [Chloroflexota bacterium]